MQENHSVSRASDRLEISYTDKPVSGWGGFVLVVRFFDKLGLREMLKRALPDGRTSNNQIPVVDIMLSFFAKEFLDDLESRNLAYAIVVRMTRPIQIAIAGIREWTAFGPGLEATDFMYRAHGGRKPRRLVVVREEVRERPEARGRKLIHVPGYTFHALVTTLDDLAPADAWRFYNGRADCENRLKELKDDFGASGFCLHSFDGTEAVFRLVCFLFNLVAEFKREVTFNEKPQLDTLRARLLVVGAILGAAGRNRVLRLGLKDELREAFQQLLVRIAALSFSTVAQSEKNEVERAPVSPTPWRERRRHRPARSSLSHAFALN